MKLTIEPTPDFFMLGDVMVRKWLGVDQDDRPVVALVTLVGSPAATYENLVEIPPPDREAAVRWAKNVLAGEDGA